MATWRHKGARRLGQKAGHGTRSAFAKLPIKRIGSILKTESNCSCHSKTRKFNEKNQRKNLKFNRGFTFELKRSSKCKIRKSLQHVTVEQRFCDVRISVTKNSEHLCLISGSQ